MHPWAIVEWRIFIPARDLAKAEKSAPGLQSFLSQMQEIEPKTREDIYLALNDSIGVKLRGRKGRLEVKMRMEEASCAQGKAESWSKSKVSGQGMEDAEERTREFLQNSGSWTSDLEGMLANVTYVKFEKQVRKQIAGNVIMEMTPLFVDAMHQSTGAWQASNAETGEEWVTCCVEGTWEEVKAFFHDNDIGHALTMLAEHKEAYQMGYPGFVMEQVKRRRASASVSARKEPSPGYSNGKLKGVGNGHGDEEQERDGLSVAVLVVDRINELVLERLATGVVEPGGTFKSTALHVGEQFAGVPIKLVGVLNLEITHASAAAVVRRPEGACNSMRAVMLASPSTGFCLDEHRCKKWDELSDTSALSKWVGIVKSFDGAAIAPLSLLSEQIDQAHSKGKEGRKKEEVRERRSSLPMVRDRASQLQPRQLFKDKRRSSSVSSGSSFDAAHQGGPCKQS